MRANPVSDLTENSDGRYEIQAADTRNAALATIAATGGLGAHTFAEENTDDPLLAIDPSSGVVSFVGGQVGGSRRTITVSVSDESNVDDLLFTLAFQVLGAPPSLTLTPQWSIWTEEQYRATDRSDDDFTHVADLINPGGLDASEIEYQPIGGSCEEEGSGAPICTNGETGNAFFGPFHVYSDAPNRVVLRPGPENSADPYTFERATVTVRAQRVLQPEEEFGQLALTLEIIRVNLDDTDSDADTNGRSADAPYTYALPDASDSTAAYTLTGVSPPSDLAFATMTITARTSFSGVPRAGGDGGLTVLGRTGGDVHTLSLAAETVGELSGANDITVQVLGALRAQRRDARVFVTVNANVCARTFTPHFFSGGDIIDARTHSGVNLLSDIARIGTRTGGNVVRDYNFYWHAGVPSQNSELHFRATLFNSNTQLPMFVAGEEVVAGHIMSIVPRNEGLAGASESGQHLSPC